ncbi:uncharacterized protein AKAME5_000094800 [Lates japonicus]|uniref:Uncharacterized protein n=1 Tax=Lates japonicus TaxID=270547 RepID=A0AAD3QWX3_LATJO|nr:uncharacterized protein AKAME5_000094800 [Lates japonicus]
MMMLLLVSAVALLVSPAVASPTLHPVYCVADLLEVVETFSSSFKKQVFVEDVQDLVDSGCGDKFFCKVQDILHKHAEITKGRNDEVNCTELLHGMTPAGTEILIPKLLDHLKHCIQQTAFQGLGESNLEYGPNHQSCCPSIETPPAAPEVPNLWHRL